MNIEADESQRGQHSQVNPGAEAYLNLASETKRPSDIEMYTKLAERVYVMGKEASENDQASQESKNLSMRILRKADSLGIASSRNPNIAPALRASLLGAARLCANSEQYFAQPHDAMPIFDPMALTAQERHAMEDELEDIFFTKSGENAIPGVSLRWAHPDKDHKDVWMPALAFTREAPTQGRHRAAPSEAPIEDAGPIGTRVQMDNLYAQQAHPATVLSESIGGTTPGHLPNREAASHSTAHEAENQVDPIPTRPESQMIHNRTAEMYTRTIDFQSWSHTDRGQFDPMLDSYRRLLYDRYKEVNNSEPQHLFEPVPLDTSGKPTDKPEEVTSTQSAAAFIHDAVGPKAFAFLRLPKTGQPAKDVELYIGRADNPVSDKVLGELSTVFDADVDTAEEFQWNFTDPENSSYTEFITSKRVPTALPGIHLEKDTVAYGPGVKGADGKHRADSTRIWLVRESVEPVPAHERPAHSPQAQEQTADQPAIGAGQEARANPVASTAYEQTADQVVLPASQRLADNPPQPEGNDATGAQGGGKHAGIRRGFLSGWRHRGRRGQ